MTYTVEQIIDKVQKEYPYGVSLYYVDYRDSLDEHDDVIQAIIEGDYDLINEKISEWYMEQPGDTINAIMSEIGVDLYSHDDETIETVRNWFYDNDDSDVVRSLLKNTGKVKMRIQMTSTYDCGASDWLHGGEYQYQDSFFGSAMKGLGINPKGMKNLLENEYDGKCKGPRPKRKDWGYIKPDDFMHEHFNTSYGWLPCFAVSVDLEDIYDAGGIDGAKITIKEGTPFGLMNDWIGSCSPFDSRLQKDMTITLGKETGDDAIEWFARFDSSGYGLDEVAGMTDRFWNQGKIEIK